MSNGAHNGPEYCIHGAPMSDGCKSCAAISASMQGEDAPERFKRGEAVEILAVKQCDIHRYVMDQPGVEARYDGKTKGGPWANMCQECFNKHGIGLGTGRGQRLVVTRKGR